MNTLINNLEASSRGIDCKKMLSIGASIWESNPQVGLKNNFIRIFVCIILFGALSTNMCLASGGDDGKIDICDTNNDYNLTTLVFESELKIGYIGVDAANNIDQPDDNIFKLEINERINEDYNVWLEYELEGVADAASIALSINDRSSIGGYVIHKAEGWHSQKELIRASWLSAGANYIQFSHRTGQGFRYGVRGVRVLAQLKDQANHTNVHWSSAIGNKEEGHLYARGILSTNIINQVTAIRANGEFISVQDGGFEVLLTKNNAAKDGNLDHNIQLHMTDGTILVEAIDWPTSQNTSCVAERIDHYRQERGHFPMNKSQQLNIGRASVQAEANILKYDVNIEMTSLRRSDLAPLEISLKNVTGDFDGFRFLPHGQHFADTGAVLIMPYDKHRIPVGYTEQDVRIFYFDREESRWMSLQRDSINQELGLIYAHVTHFTDFITGVISSPESPTSSAYVPTEFEDVAMATPSAGIQLISPPSASQQGDANLQYPILVAPGRRGIQPSLAVTYNSEGANGLLGVGWDLNIPSITIETRWGAPRYDPLLESEAYMLNGQQLVTEDGSGGFYLPHRRDHDPANGLDGWIDRTTDRVFHVRAKSSSNFERIIRRGDNPANYTWEVTDKSGIKYFYGGAGAQLTTSDGRGNISKWCLTRVEDLYTNYM